MANKQLLYSALVLPLIAGIVVRQTVGGPSVFRGEFVIEDFILLLALTGGFAPSRFKRLILCLISCVIGTTMVLFPLPRVNVSTIIFALFTILAAVRALIELSKLRGTRE
jgi:uncharacterized membrane protein YccC